MRVQVRLARLLLLYPSHTHHTCTRLLLLLLRALDRPLVHPSLPRHHLRVEMISFLPRSRPSLAPAPTPCSQAGTREYPRIHAPATPRSRAVATAAADGSETRPLRSRAACSACSPSHASSDTARFYGREKDEGYACSIDCCCCHASSFSDRNVSTACVSASTIDRGNRP